MKRRNLSKLYFKSEAELVALTRDWLVGDGWEVFLEVAPWGAGAARADIVATRGPMIAVFEAKLSMSLALIEQCQTWTRYAHLVWCAVPPLRGSRFAQKVAKAFGFGVVQLHPSDEFGRGYTSAPRAEVQEEPAFSRRIDPMLRKHLHASCKTIRPGASTGFITPFQLTCERLRESVRFHQGRILVKTAIDSLKHHYSSTSCARASLISRVEAGVVKGLKVEREGRQVFFVEASK